MTRVETAAENPDPPDAFGAALAGLGPIGILAILAVLAAGNTIPGLGGALVVLWRGWTRTPWPSLGYVRPPRPWLTLPLALVAGIAFKLVMKALVMPLLGADPINHAYHGLAGNAAAVTGAVVLVVVGGGFGEETVFRGFLFERFGRLFGGGRLASVGVLLATTALFASLHGLDQGRVGVEQAVFTGLTFGVVRMRTGRLAEVMVAHAAFDLAAVAMIYANLEARVAHLIFR